MHIVVNGWFLGQSSAGSGQYVDHLLATLPAYAPAARWTVLVPAATPHNFAHPKIQLIPQSLPRLPRQLAKL